jgi:hypothetical protein
MYTKQDLLDAFLHGAGKIGELETLGNFFLKKFESWLETRKPAITIDSDSLHETIADIAYAAGYRNYYSGDGREDISDFIMWAKEFEESIAQKDDDEVDYLEKISDFADKKLDAAQPEPLFNMFENIKQDLVSEIKNVCKGGYRKLWLTDPIYIAGEYKSKNVEIVTPTHEIVAFDSDCAYIQKIGEESYFVYAFSECGTEELFELYQRTKKRMFADKRPIKNEQENTSTLF